VVDRAEPASSVDSGGLLRPPENHMGTVRHMGKKERDDVVRKASREFWDAKEALGVLEAAIEELSKSSSITTDEGYLMLSPSGIRLLDTYYAIEVVAQYRAAKQMKERLRKHIIELGEPDPDPPSS